MHTCGASSYKAVKIDSGLIMSHKEERRSNE